jgi:hypothetical protein
LVDVRKQDTAHVAGDVIAIPVLDHMKLLNLVNLNLIIIQSII